MSLSALSRYRDAGEPVIFLCSLSRGRNLRSKDVLSSFKVCWYKLSQASKLRELRGTEHLTKQCGVFFPSVLWWTRCWKGVQLSFLIYRIVAVIILLALECVKTFVLDSSVGFPPPLSVSVCSLKGVGFNLYGQRSIFSLLTIHKSCSAPVFIWENFRKGTEDEFPVWNYKENVCRQN